MREVEVSFGITFFFPQMSLLPSFFFFSQPTTMEIDMGLTPLFSAPRGLYACGVGLGGSSQNRGASFGFMRPNSFFQTLKYST